MMSSYWDRDVTLFLKCVVCECFIPLLVNVNDKKWGGGVGEGGGGGGWAVGEYVGALYSVENKGFNKEQIFV